MKAENEETQQAADHAIMAAEARLTRRLWWNWVLLLGVAVVSTVGLTTAILPLLAVRMKPLWPWENTEFVLLAGLSLAVLALAVYLTAQQRRVATLSRELSHRARQHHGRLVALLNVSRIMGTETSLQTVFDGITQTCHEAFGGERVSLMLLDNRTQLLVVQSAAGHRRGVVGTCQPVGKGIAGWVAQHRRGIIVGRDVDETKYPGFRRREGAPTEAMVVPIVLRQDLVGVLNVAKQENEHAYTEDDLSALEVFAQNAGTCIRHAEQTEWMRQLIENKQERQAEVGRRKRSATDAENQEIS